MPELTPTEAITSTELRTLTPFKFPAVAMPMVKPVTVTVTAVLAAIPCVAVVMMIWVLVGVATEPVGPLPLICTPGDPELTKKLDGYVSVMVLPVASAPPAVVVNENVAAAPVLPATRSDDAIANEGLVTCPPITPELNPEDAV